MAYTALPKLFSTMHIIAKAMPTNQGQSQQILSDPAIVIQFTI